MIQLTNPNHRLIAFFLLTIVVGGVLIVGVVLETRAQTMRERQRALMLSPLPAPSWMLSLAPQPAQSLSVDHAVFGNTISDQFWPGEGAICVQVDDIAVGIGSTEQLRAQTTMFLNDEPIIEVRDGWLRHGFREIQGSIYSSFAKGPVGLNICWRIILEPGDYLAKLQVAQNLAPPLIYSWAFRLTDK